MAEDLRRRAELQRAGAERGRRQGFERGEADAREAVREQAEVLSEMRASDEGLRGKVEQAPVDESPPAPARKHRQDRK